MLKNNLLKNGMYYIIGGALLQSVNFITLPIFTRLLSVENFGMVSIYNTWSNILAIFISLQFQASIGNAKIYYSKEEFKKYISNIMLLSTLIFIAWVIIFFIFKKKISRFLNLPINVIWIMLIQSFFYTIIILKTTIYIYDQEPKKKLLVSFINIFFNIVCSIFLIKYFYQMETYLGKIIGEASITIILGIFFYGTVVKENIPRINFDHWKFCLSLTIPIIFHGLSNIVLGSSDRLMLEKFKGFYEAGMYGVIYNFAMIISMIWGAMNSAWTPWYYDNMKKGNYLLIKRYSQNYIKIVTMISVGFLLLSPEVIKIMIPSKYWAGLKLLPFLVIGNYFNYLYSFPVSYEFYSKKTKYIALATTGAALINFLLNLYFIPKYSGLGAAITTLIAYLCMFLFHEIITRIKFKYSILTKFEYLKEIVVLFIFVGAYYLFLDKIFIRIIILILYSAVSSINFYKIIKRQFHENCNSNNLIQE